MCLRARRSLPGRPYEDIRKSSRLSSYGLPSVKGRHIGGLDLHIGQWTCQSALGGRIESSPSFGGSTDIGLLDGISGKGQGRSSLSGGFHLLGVDILD